MSEKPTKLKKMKLTSVDLVRRGANQEAYINLYKSAGDPENPNAPAEPPESPNPAEIPQGLWKSIVDLVKGFMSTNEGEEDSHEEPEEVDKSADTFKDRMMQQEIRDNRWKYQDALNCSIESILNDNDISDEEKVSMMNTSIEQFANAYKELCEKLVTTANKTEEPKMVGKSQEEVPEETEEGEEEMKIDKSRFNPEELAAYEMLIAKGRVEDDIEKEEDEEEKEFPLPKKDELHPEVKKALDEMAAFRKGIEMKEMADIAKKYSILGKNEAELASTLYDMKKSSPASYDAYLAVLDQNLELVNKSGMYEEIGKSSRGLAGGSTEDKIHGIAKSYIEKDPSMDYNTAVLKAWENNPELMAEYDGTY